MSRFLTTALTILTAISVMMGSVSSNVFAQDDATPEPTVEATATVSPEGQPTVELSTATPEAPVPTALVTDTPVPTSPEADASPTVPEEPTPAITATSLPTDLPPTATSSPTATATPEDAVVTGTTRTLTIHSVDLDGNPINLGCFDIYLDIGGGVRGTRVIADACDWGGSGIISVQIVPGSYILVETRHGNLYGRAFDKPFTIGSSRTLTVKHEPIGSMVITSVDVQTGLPVSGACYDLIPLTEIIIPPSYFSCDFFDHDLDGVTTINTVDRGTYTLVLKDPPLGYLNASNRDVTVSVLSSPRAVTVSYKKGATVLIHKQDEDGEPLPGACFGLYTNENGAAGEPVGTQFCDGDFDQNDGDVEGLGFKTGSYILREMSSPPGYLRVADQAIALTAGQTLESTIVDPTGGSIEIHVTDGLGNPLDDICPHIFKDAGGGVRGKLLTTQPPCDGGASWQDGISTIIGLPAGDYLLAQSLQQPPTPGVNGYAPSVDIPFTIALGEHKVIEVVNLLGGTLAVTTVDALNPATRIPGTCFMVFLDAGGGTRGAQVGYGCDGVNGSPGTQDGVTNLIGFPTGSYVLAQSAAPDGFNYAPDIPFAIATGEAKTLTASDTPWGKIRVHKQSPTGTTLKGACFAPVLSGDPPYRYVRSTPVCDNADGSSDGLIQMAVPDGEFELRETKAPAGYARAPITDVEVVGGGSIDVTVVDPVMSTIVLRFVNVWGEQVTGLCLDLYGTNKELGNLGVEGACDDDDGSLDSRVTFSALEWGRWKPKPGNLGKYIMPGIQIDLAPGESKSVRIVLTEPSPSFTVAPRIDGITQSSFTIYWETDQKMITSAIYTLDGEPGTTLPETPGEPTRIHRVTITGLSPNTTYVVRAKPTSPNGNLTSARLTPRTLPLGAEGRLIATFESAGGALLPGACMSIYRDQGDGQAGALLRNTCDRSDGDGPNGKISISGLPVGSFVLINYYAPAGYQLSPQRTFSLTEGQTKRLTVTNPSGGAVVSVTSREYGGSNLPDTCFTIYQNLGNDEVGDYVTDLCDGFDALDGIANFSGIGPGNYFVWQYRVAPGYIADPIKAFTVQEGQTKRSIVLYSRRLTDPDNIYLKTVDRSGAAIPGACFWLYKSTNNQLNDYVADRCDADDGILDGATYFTNIAANTYAVLEYWAPSGYVVGTVTYLTKESNKRITKKVTQVAGGVTVKISTLKGSTSSPLPGACYGLYRLFYNDYVAVGVACDGWDGSIDGQTTIRGVPAGTYLLFQNHTPSGYATPDAFNVTIGTTIKAITVRTYPK